MVIELLEAHSILDEILVWVTKIDRPKLSNSTCAIYYLSALKDLKALAHQLSMDFHNGSVCKEAKIF
jgi:hypothetical protein